MGVGEGNEEVRGGDDEESCKMSGIEEWNEGFELGMGFYRVDEVGGG